MKQQKGTIFDIQRFSLNDGPGIRTTIFLKGCPLSCSWCHNFESQDGSKQLFFDTEKCISCGSCQEVCPNNAHSFATNHKLKPEHCDLSGKCVEVCSSEALRIIGTEIQTAEIMTEVEKDKAFYKRSGGGVTISGGEPMYQFLFLCELVQQLNLHKYHICLDTSGFASKTLFEKIMPYVNLFHFDLKLLDAGIHKKETGVGLTVILENLHFIASRRKEIILRCPIIPGINDHKLHFEKVVAIAARYPSIKRIDVLPYHKMGVKKAKILGSKISPVAAFKEPSDEQLEQWEAWMTELSKTPFQIRR